MPAKRWTRKDSSDLDRQRKEQAKRDKAARVAWEKKSKVKVKKDPEGTGS